MDHYPSTGVTRGKTVKINCQKTLKGRYVYVQLNVEDYLTLCEVQVFGPTGNVVVNGDFEDASSEGRALFAVTGEGSVSSYQLGAPANGFDKTYFVGTAKTKLTLRTTRTSKNCQQGGDCPSGICLSSGKCQTDNMVVRRDTKYKLTMRYRSNAAVTSGDATAYGFIIPPNKAPMSKVAEAFFETDAEGGNAPLQLSVSGGGAYLEIDDIALEQVNFINRAFIDVSMPDSSPLAVMGIRLTDVPGKPSCGDLTLGALANAKGGNYRPVAQVSAQATGDETVVSIRGGASTSWRIYGMPTEESTCGVEVDVFTRLADPEQQQCIDKCAAPSMGTWSKVACRMGCDIAAFGVTSEVTNKLFDASSCASLPGLFADSEDVPFEAEDEDLVGACRAAMDGYSYSKRITCPDDMTIESIAFASYGNPTGSCGEGPSSLKFGTCHAASSKQVVEQLCVGKSSCTVMATNEAFSGDPCQGTRKRLAVTANCVMMSAGLSKRVPYKLTVTAVDREGASTTAKVVVAVKDLNEVPTIEPQEAKMSENSVSGTKVGRPMAALSADPDVSDVLSYSVVGGSGGGPSTSRSTGNSGQLSANLENGCNAQLREHERVHGGYVRATDDSTKDPGVLLGRRDRGRLASAMPTRRR